MRLQKIILNIVLNIEAFFMSFFKIKTNRITFISLESDILQYDFKLIYDELDKDKYDIKQCLILYKKNLIGQFLYFINCLKQLYYVYTSRLVILNDNNYVVSNFKRKGIIVLQVWHACGAIKKFGNVINREYPISNYDYILSTSSFWKKPYSKAFSVSEENIIPLGMPRNDELFNEKLKRIYKDELINKYPIIKDKKIILYAPTFRGNIYKGFSRIDFNAKKIVDKLGNNYVLLYKYHPLLGNVELVSDNRVVNVNHEDTHQLFCICDYMISDYSSIVFDYLILEKPLIFFVPDLKKYCDDLGVFVDITKLNCPICMNEDDIVNYINRNDFDLDNFKRLKNIFFDYQDQYSTKRVVEWIDDLLENKV